MANSIHWKSLDTEKPKSVALHIGDTLRVHYKLIEREKVAGKTKREVNEETRERTQVFEGILLAIKGSGGVNAMITVRHMGAGAIGVERIFPLVSPWIKNIEVKNRALVRRAKLYYLREKHGRDSVKLHESTRPIEATSATA